MQGGDSYAEALAVSRLRQAETGALEVHAYDHADVLAGQGTVGRELDQDAPELTYILVATGGGYQHGADAEASLRAYATDVANFPAWCAKHGFTAIPATRETVGAYLAAAG